MPLEQLVRAFAAEWGLRPHECTELLERARQTEAELAEVK